MSEKGLMRIDGNGYSILSIAVHKILKCDYILNAYLVLCDKSFCDCNISTVNVPRLATSCPECAPAVNEIITFVR